MLKSSVFAALVVADMWLHMHLSACKHIVIERWELFLQTCVSGSRVKMRVLPTAKVLYCHNPF